MEQTSFYTYIKLAGKDDFSLDEVTKRLGVEPTGDRSLYFKE
ncbi:hypothetical protein [Solibacillus ferritrahens]